MSKFVKTSQLWHESNALQDQPDHRLVWTDTFDQHASVSIEMQEYNWYHQVMSRSCHNLCHKWRWVITQAKRISGELLCWVTTMVYLNLFTTIARMPCESLHLSSFDKWCKQLNPDTRHKIILLAGCSRSLWSSKPISALDFQFAFFYLTDALVIGHAFSCSRNYSKMPSE